MKILVASHLERSAIRQLQERHDVVCTFDQPTADPFSLVRDREALVFRSGVEIARALMECAPHLKLLVRAGCGLDNLDCEYVRQRGIVLRRIPEPAAQAVAEMALAFMFALSRNIRQADAMLRQGRWAKDTLEGHLLAGKVLGIVGAGNIGSRLGTLASMIGMETIGCIADSTPAAVQTLRNKGITVADFETVLAAADFVIAVPDVQIGVAHPRGEHFQEHLRALRLRRFLLVHLQRRAALADLKAAHFHLNASHASRPGQASPDP